MKKLFLLSLLACLSLQAQQPPAVSIPIQNASFEQGYTGWRFGAGSRIESGVAVAGYGSAFSQTLSVSPDIVQAWPGRPGYHIEGTYVLKFSVVNYLPSYPGGYYEAKLSFGTQELCDVSGWGKRVQREITLACPSPGYLIVDKALPLGGPAQGKQPLAISFHVNDWALLFDKVSLEFIPD